MKTRSGALHGVSVALLGFLYLPIVVVIVYSFNATRHGVAWSGFTLEWYRALLGNDLVLAAVRNTLWLAGASTLISTVLGTLLGCGLDRFRPAGRRWCGRLLQLPMVMPDIVMAVALVILFSLVRRWTGWFQLGMGTMVLAHVTLQIPFVAIVVRSRLAGFDSSLAEAAQDLGASRFQAFWWVTFPLILPGILVGALLAFTLSLDDFVLSFFTTGPGASTLPIFIYSSVKRGITPEVNALSAIVIAVSIVAIVILTLLQRRWLR